jgi:DNA-binding transcriptional LysR family regulator
MNPELLRGMAVFVEVAKAKSFTRAAEVLGMPKSTVSRRITLLERNIGLRLLKRTTQKVELTDEGMGYFGRCQRILEEAQVAHDELTRTRHQPRGHLRAAMTADFGLRLVSGIPDFFRRFPDLSLEFDFTTRRVDPMTENYDVAIHIGAPPDSSLTARKLAEIPEYLYAAPDYLGGRTAPATPADLSDHECIRETRVHGTGIPSTWMLVNADKRVEVEVRGKLALNGVGLIRRLAVGGAGVAVLPEGFCREDVKAGRLVRVLDGWSAPLVPIYALMAARLMPAKTRVFLDFLESQL